MKKISLLICVLIVITSVFSGCGSDGKSSGATPDQAVTTAAKSTPDQTSDSATGEDASWFDDAVFVGDSVTNMLNIYCMNDPEALGKAQFVCAPSLGFTNAQWALDDENNVHPSYKGKTVLAERAAELTGANKVLIMLGMNDIGIYGADGALDESKKFTQKLLSHSPNVKLYFQSVTPKMTSHEDNTIDNNLIKDFDSKLEKFCNENGYKYLDVYHQVCDETDALPEKYCGDPEPDEGQGIHFNTEACEIWIDFLKKNV